MPILAPNPSSLDDAEKQERQLLAAIVAADSGAMQVFYRNYRIRLGVFLFRLCHEQTLVDEIFNEVMLVVWQKAFQFNETSKVSTWVFSIAYRLCLKKLGDEKKQARLKVALNEQSEMNEMLVSEHQQVIARALDQLSLEQRTVVTLAFVQGYNYAEIGEITSTSENTVKTRMFYARKKLQAALADQGVDISAQSQE